MSNIEYVTVEFEHWYDIQKLLNARQPNKWTVLRMPASGVMGGNGLMVLEIIDEPAELTSQNN